MRKLLPLLLATLLGACIGLPEAELDLLYNEAASYHAPDRNPIVVIPGALGSTLRDRLSGVLVWGAFDAHAVDPNRADGARLISLPLDEAEPDALEPVGVLERIKVRLAGLPIQLEVYARLLATLGAAGYRDEALGTAGEVDYGEDHFTCFQFAYDWRRDNVENASRLHAFLLEKRAYVQEEYRRRYGIDDADVKFDIVAHSMGGLIARYFLRYGSQDLPSDGGLPDLDWSGAQLAERVILIAPPNAGSLNALEALVEGRKLGPALPFYPPAVVGTFPSSYQLLPRPRHHAVVWEHDQTPVENLLDPSLWERLEWGLASRDQDRVLRLLMPDVRDRETRRERALATQRRALTRAKAFMAAIDRPATAPSWLDLYLIAGDADATPRRASVRRDDGALRIVERAPGDGTVLRSSVLLDEREGPRPWRPTLVTPISYHSIMLLPESHLGITKNGAFRDNMLFWLLEEPRGSRNEPQDVGAISESGARSQTTSSSTRLR